MFQPKTDRVKELAAKYPQRVKELERVFEKPSNNYIDFSNVIGWQNKLGWHVDLKRIKQLLSSFDTVREIKLYSGTLIGDKKSEDFIKEAKECGYKLVTKPVKIMKISIDVSSISPESPEILKQFIRPPLLQKLNIETIKLMNTKLRELNQQGILFLEDRKCNFDVEIGRDMLIDYAADQVENFVLWSGDSDFADPIRQLLNVDKKVVLFATARRVATELNDLVKDGLFIFDIQKVRDFICWPKEIDHKMQKGLTK